MITQRLKTVVNYVNAGTAADIGTDHAYVPIELIRSGRAKRVIASDARSGPLGFARSNIERYGLCDRIDVRLGSGLDVLEAGEADVIIIAGMGGELIEDIIRSGEEIARASELILQPMNAQYELRRYLIENGFSIESERLALEGFRVYNLMRAVNGRQAPFERDIDYHLPPCLYKDENFHALLKKKQREFKKIIKGLEKSEICDIIRLEYFKKCYKASEDIDNVIS